MFEKMCGYFLVTHSLAIILTACVDCNDIFYANDFLIRKSGTAVPPRSSMIPS